MSDSDPRIPTVTASHSTGAGPFIVAVILVVVYLVHPVHDQLVAGSVSFPVLGG